MNWPVPRGLSAILGAGLLLCGSAPLVAEAAAPDEAAALADFFKGVLEIDVPAAGWSTKRYLAADHTYSETGSDGPVRGTWALQGDQVCTTAYRSVGDDRLKTYCTAAVGKHAGDIWRAEDPVTGNTVMFRLSPGR